MAVRDIWAPDSGYWSTTYTGQIRFVHVLPTFSVVTSGRNVYLAFPTVVASAGSSGTGGEAGTTIIAAGNYPWIG